MEVLNLELKELLVASISRNRKMVLNLDLNCPPQDEDSLGINNSLNVDTTLKLGLPCVQVRTSYEPDDDEVIICSPRSFAEAVNKSRRNRTVIEVVDDESEFQGADSARRPGNGNRCPRISAKQRGGGVNTRVHWVDQDLVELSQPVPQQKAPTFSCPKFSTNVPPVGVSLKQKMFSGSTFLILNNYSMPMVPNSDISKVKFKS
ncbi:unnamed protein product [Fraxinus pennsylvanica]|uniref:Uncharacterized protein n=1 Tax=Fraxinus pennsylvanica TaxID=56036 RepID=A0AAD2DPH7_9LAMI|nr:unnamed protein product [Fraxinus pennsylvanica]